MINFDLLKDAYAIIGGIPDNRIYLDTVVIPRGHAPAKGTDCGAIACGIGWLGLHPKFQQLGLETTENGLKMDGSSVSYIAAAKAVFGVEYADAEKLFRPSEYSVRLRMGNNHTHKKELLNRIMSYLDERGQVKNPTYF